MPRSVLDPTSTDERGSAQIERLLGVLPGPAPVVWGPAGRVLVVGAHPGDALAAFGVGLRALLDEGWELTVMTLWGMPSPQQSSVTAAQEAWDANHRLLSETVGLHDHRTRSLGWQHRPAQEHLVQFLSDTAHDYELVIGPLDRSADPHPDHGFLARALDCLTTVPVHRFLIPGQSLPPAAVDRIRRVCAPDCTGTLRKARQALRSAMACMPPAAPTDGAATGITTATDLMLLGARSGSVHQHRGVQPAGQFHEPCGATHDGGLSEVFS